MASQAPQRPAIFPSESWIRAGFCGPNGGNCVEVNLGLAGLVGVRDSKPGSGPELLFAGQNWATFLGDACEGRFDG